MFGGTKMSETKGEFTKAVVDTSDNSTTVTTGTIIVRGAWVNTVLSAHVVILKDGTTSIFTIPASTPAGTWLPFGDTVFNTSLVVDPDDSSSGNITVVYKEILPV